MDAEMNKSQMKEALEACRKRLNEYQTPSLRDQFAMAALTGMIGDSMEAGNMPTEHHMGLIAVGAYEVADAMMKARKGDKD